MGVLGALAGGAMAVLAPDLIFHLISPRFTEAVAILRILAVAAFLIYLNNAFAHAMVAVGIQGPGFLSTRIAAAGINVVLNLLWIPVWGGQGAAWATVASEGVILLLAPLFVRRRAGVWPPLWGPVLGGAALWLSGAAPLEPTWAGRLAGCGVLAGALLIFLAFHRRQVVDLLVGLRVLKPKPGTEGPANPRTED
ncbi:MAG: polysaccharide biosynthesis C-terminal domain-containing protein [Nitrospinota bacterium]|jgi:O-antigen/teichoic acid export membrane protein|nr:polysaccharide biosynthesis C-terminal domain-containing protein [Nitrospinota bacterium]MDP6619882.1 polysaccharide biosynthesis C-terminal domain-containing protein [Nitrospinota bacterium]HJM41913.1 polysaccharide biosynthesis C-terminal domain-containing protein [Nitrospinota bacterium]